VSGLGELIRCNFLDVCERCEIEPEAALDACAGTLADIEDDEARDDLFYGIGYVRGIADAMDLTALQLIDHYEGNTP